MVLFVVVARCQEPAAMPRVEQAWVGWAGSRVRHHFLIATRKGFRAQQYSKCQLRLRADMAAEN